MKPRSRQLACHPFFGKSAPFHRWPKFPIEFWPSMDESRGIRPAPVTSILAIFERRITDGVPFYQR